MADTSFILFTLGPVQSFIKAARTVRDLWSGSYLLSYLTFRAMKAVADQSGQGAGAIVFPDVTQLPLWGWEAGGCRKPAPPGVREPCIPNRFLAEVKGDETYARDLASAAESACRLAWQKIAEDVRAYLFRAHGHPSFDADDARTNLWHRQVDTFFEVYTGVLPQKEYGADRITTLLGRTTGEPWADRHQVAQKVLAAVKNRRHFPVYAPTFVGDVPQKDTLLGTLEHLGPGNRQAANDFWVAVATAWHAHGSKVTRRERFSAISLVKRFAWAHHFAKEFGFDDRRVLKFQDTATAAAKKWLADEKAPDPRDLLSDKKDPLWSGQWLHWPTAEPPDDDIDEDRVPDTVWNAILTKKRFQNKPPAYYAVFVFDGDKMGDRFNAATSAPMYGAISNALGNFALHVIKGVVEKHDGELIYAGGDDAICVLPTETALACASEIKDAFRDNWLRKLPNDKPATISGGLVVAHYKEDLRFVMDEAHKAEKRSKDAGRNALTVTVCRRSGEHSSAVIPWEFVPAVGGWVSGFLAKASDRWAYKLRGDLPTLGEDVEMFNMELGRQLCRAEEITRKQFPDKLLKDQFEQYRRSILADERLKSRKAPATAADAIADFVTLLQTASFLARGRDA